MAKKSGMGQDPLGWIKKTQSKEVDEYPTSEVKNLETSEVTKLETLEIPKYKTFEVQLTVRLRKDQVEHLEGLVRQIMTDRDQPYRKERITKNTLLRAYTDALKDISFKTTDIPDEAELLKRISAAIRRKR